MKCASENAYPPFVYLYVFIINLLKIISFVGGLESYQRADLRLSDISNLLGEDWVSLAGELNISTSDINKLKTDYPNSDAQQGLAMLRLWLQKAGNKAQGKQTLTINCVKKNIIK